MPRTPHIYQHNIMRHSNLKIALLVLLLSISSIQCINRSQVEYELWNFDSVQFPNELYLMHTDAKFGEFGGDSYVIRIHRAQRSKNLIITYVEYEGQAGPPMPPDPNSQWQIKDHTGQPKLYEKKGVIADNEYLILISNAIKELLGAKVNNNEEAFQVGVVNLVIYSDSTVIIKDYPSTNWHAFHLLKDKIKKE